jgi:hypothetical protein
VRTKVIFSFENITKSAGGLAGNAIAAAAAQAAARLLEEGIPQFAGGGTFRANGGAGLAVLHDGERVLTPEQQANGTGNTFVFNGSVMLERDLLTFIDRAQRRGFRR